MSSYPFLDPPFPEISGLNEAREHPRLIPPIRDLPARDFPLRPGFGTSINEPGWTRGMPSIGPLPMIHIGAR